MSRLSIRFKLLIVFMALLTVAFAGVFTWFYQSAAARAMASLRQDLEKTASLTASLIDGDEHARLVASGTQGDADYAQIAAQLHQVYATDREHIIDIYTMVRSANPNELAFVVDLGAAYPQEIYEAPDALTAAEKIYMGRPYDISAVSEILKGFQGPAADTRIITDAELGDTLSGYAPIRDSAGNAVAIVGVDMDAAEVRQVRMDILTASLVAFGIAFVLSFAAIYWLSGVITRSLRLITDASTSLEKGEPFEPAQLEPVTRSKDELGNLARMFSRMAVQVQARERELKDTVSNLRIEIDEMKRKTSVAEIADNAEFQALKDKARELRRQRDEGS